MTNSTRDLIPGARRALTPVRGALVAACLLAVPAASLAQQGARCPDGSRNAIPVDVMVLAQSGTMKVEPASVSIHMKAEAGANRVCWVAVGILAGYKVQLVGEEGTFPQFRGWLTPDEPSTNSGFPVKAGTWPYQAILHRPDAEPVVVEGLSVVIKP